MKKGVCCGFNFRQIINGIDDVIRVDTQYITGKINAVNPYHPGCIIIGGFGISPRPVAQGYPAESSMNDAVKNTEAVAFTGRNVSSPGRIYAGINSFHPYRPTFAANPAIAI